MPAAYTVTWMCRVCEDHGTFTTLSDTTEEELPYAVAAHHQCAIDQELSCRLMLWSYDKLAA